MKEIRHYYRTDGQAFEVCFNVEVSEALTQDEERIIRWLLAETFFPKQLSRTKNLYGERVFEVGPLLNFATPFNSNALSILRNCGITKVTRIERSKRMVLPDGEMASCDRMTEGIYAEGLSSFDSGLAPEAIYALPLMEEGLEAFSKIQGLSMDEHDKKTYYDYFVGQCHRNPTIAEIMDLNNANSEHSRHGYFKGRQVIDGQLMPETLMEIVKSTLGTKTNSLVAFSDNSSVIRGYMINSLIPKDPGEFSEMVEKKLTYHFLFTAETHNFPSGIAPVPGAETGTGGRIRDVQATGRGGLMLAGTAGYCVGNLYLENYDLPWERKGLIYPSNLASPLSILIKASNGASDYGNKIGEPLIQGFVRSGASHMPKGERREWIKPIMFTGGIGQIDDQHLFKQGAEKGMLIVQIGGPAYRIGFGGGSASSLMQGENVEKLDFNAVQRGDPEMEQKMNRVVRACVELGDNNPIISIHDQGAGGPANVLKELVEHAGGRIDIRKINVGDPSLSVLEIWVCEYQERNGLLLKPESLQRFQAICEREKVACEVLGEVTSDGRFVVEDSLDGTTPVDMELRAVLGGMPQKTFYSEREKTVFEAFALPENADLVDALHRVLKLTSVGSKRFLTNKVDRSVTGLIAQQQCCGPLQLPVADVSVVAQSHFPNAAGKYSGAAIAIGEQPIKMLLDPSAGARMAVAEAITNIAWARLSKLTDIKASANWMGAPKLPGEGAKMYDAALAMRRLMLNLGIAVDGGKDSLSMATKVAQGDTTEMVKSPLELVISLYCSMPDVTKVVTPDIKHAGESKIMRIDLTEGKRRLGGSALAQAYGQIGNDCPDIDEPFLLMHGFEFIQECIDHQLILSGHDISDGGMITSLLEMIFSGNCGFSGVIRGDALKEMFAEECGFLIEYRETDEAEIISRISRYGIDYQILGRTTQEKYLTLSLPKHDKIDMGMEQLRQVWESTSYNLEKLQCKQAEQERRNIFSRQGPDYYFNFGLQVNPERSGAYKVAIIREEGSNGDREMSSAFHQAGFTTFDVNMTDLLSGRVDLSDFRGVAFVGGFSYADVLDSAKGWAGVIRFNPNLKKMFEDFYKRPDTFSLGVCNGCQLSALLGWVPGGDIADNVQPRFIQNISERYESRFSTVVIKESPAIMLKGMEGSRLGIWVAHGEGRFYCSDHHVNSMLQKEGLAPIRYISDEGHITEKYPFNPNGSPDGIAALCDKSGRHLAMMPHPERTFIKWQWPYWPSKWQAEDRSPWAKMFANAYEWCKNN